MPSNQIHNNKRVAKNTLFLYLRTLLVMTISIYTSRVVLDVLGVEDYGIYNVVGGFVSMFSMLSATLTAATQRFIAYELGTENPDVKKIFSTAVSIHLVLAVIILILLESFGLWFLNNKMNIEPSRLSAANWVFQCSVITFCINLISIPYNAAIVAFEKMSAFAYISVFEVLCKLTCVYLLFLISSDSLIVYSIFMMLVAITLRLIYGHYCSRKCQNCSYKFIFDKNVFLKMFSFAGWNFIGSTAGILNVQGINILINLFFGVTLNAARGIATQVDNAINTFVQNFMMALNPQITKTYAAKDFTYVNSTIIVGSKLAFFLLWVLALPICINTDYVLNIWLKQVPDNAAMFIKLGIIYNLCQNLSQCLYTTMLATGKIKKYQIIVGGISLMAFPATYFFFKLGLSGDWGYWSMIIFSIVCLIARLFLLQDMVPGFSGVVFVKKVVFPVLMTILPTLLFTLGIHSYVQSTSAFTFIIESFESVLVSILFIWLLGMTKFERQKIKDYWHHRNK